VETPAVLPFIGDQVVCLSHDQAGPRRICIRPARKGASYPGLEISAKLATVGQSRGLSMRRRIGPLVRPKLTLASERYSKP
jgi:hypothetical protein